VLEGGLLPGGAKAGDVLKAEAEFEIEGITIVSVVTPKESNRPEPQRIEIIGSGGPEVPGVTTQLVGRTDRRPGVGRRDRDEGRGRPQGGRDATRPRREGPAPDGDSAGRRPPRTAASDGSTHTDRPGRAGRPERPPRPDRPSRPSRPDSTDAASPTDGGDRERTSAPRAARPRPTAGAGAGRGREDATGRTGDRPPRRVAERTAAPASTERRARRFSPGRAHRNAVMASLPPEEQPIAEQVLRGGIPAVRTALHLEREKAVAEGRPAPNTDQLIAMAESLLPRLKAAEWRDRAEAATRDVEDISLRDLRSVVAGADAARDDETRALAASLREALDRRVDTLRLQWTAEVAKHLDENRVVRALRLAARPPEPAARMDPELIQRLSDAAGEAMAPDSPADRWLAVLEAVAASPVRRSVKPAGLPADPTPELRRAAHQQSGRIPALAAMLGISLPPPPLPIPPRRAATPAGARRPKGTEGLSAPAATPHQVAPDSPPVTTLTEDGAESPAAAPATHDSPDSPTALTSTPDRADSPAALAPAPASTDDLADSPAAPASTDKVPDTPDAAASAIEENPAANPTHESAANPTAAAPNHDNLENPTPAASAESNQGDLVVEELGETLTEG
jgi:hypothetical protein